MKLQNFFSKYFLEIFITVSAVWAAFDELRKLTPSSIGLAVFIVGLVITVHRIQKGLDSLLVDTSAVKDNVNRLTQDINVLQGDSNLRDLVELGRAIDKTQEPHLFAGHGATLSVYKHANQILSGVRQVHSRKTQGLDIEEQYILNYLLKELTDALPEPTVWLGVTHLTTGWERQDADPYFIEFSKSMRTRVTRGELIVLRLYCVGGNVPPELLDHLHSEVKAGIHVGILYGDPPPPDLTLLYSLKKGSITFDAEGGRDSLGRDGSPICALEFVTRNRRSIHKISMYAPGTQEFLVLGQEFDKAWKRRQPVPDS